MTVNIDDMKKEAFKSPETRPRNIYEAVGSAMDKERRKLNVVIVNLPENEPAEEGSREKKDAHSFELIVRDALRLNVKVIKCFRAGKAQGDRPRLLIATLPDLETKKELLSLTSQLRSIPRWKSLYIIPDLTTDEQLERKKLREELLARRTAGEKSLIIKRGKVISLSRNNSHGEVSGPGNQQDEGQSSRTISSRGAENLQSVHNSAANKPAPQAE